jgi:hypothetical protein
MDVYILINVVRKRTRLGNIETVTGRVAHSAPVRCETRNSYVSGPSGNRCRGRGLWSWRRRKRSRCRRCSRSCRSWGRGGPWFRCCGEIARHDKTTRPSGDTCDRDESAHSPNKGFDPPPKVARPDYKMNIFPKHSCLSINGIFVSMFLVSTETAKRSFRKKLFSAPGASKTVQSFGNGLISMIVIAIRLVFFKTSISVHLNMNERQNGQLTLAKSTVCNRIAPDVLGSD